MKMDGIKKYLRKQTLTGRKSTWSNAFASALAPFDSYSPALVAEAVRDLGQDPERDLECVYCGQPAASWDHVHSRVLAGEFTGQGHNIRNLVPCCRTCNERKGKKSWLEWLKLLDPPDLHARHVNMERFLRNAPAANVTLDAMRRVAELDLQRYWFIRAEVFRLLKEADEVAAAIREKLANAVAAPKDS